MASDFRETTWMDIHKEASGEASTSAAEASPAASSTAKVGRGRMRPAPDVYFLPRRSVGYTLAKYSAIVCAGLAAGMGIERWIRQKVAEDGGYILGGKKDSH